MKPYFESDGITIYHGDCLQIMSDLPEADLVLTDPPYSEKTHSGARGLRAASNDRIVRSAIDFESVDDAFVQKMLETIRVQAWIVATMDWKHIYELERNPPNGLRFVRFGIWVKPNSIPQLTGDRPATGWEGIAILHRSNKKMKWYGGGNRAVWTCNVVHGSHPTQKPLSLMASLVTAFSKQGDLLLDPFMGSGTTLVAAKQLGRRAIGIELMEKYCEIAVRRLENTQASLFTDTPKKKIIQNKLL